MFSIESIIINLKCNVNENEMFNWNKVPFALTSINCSECLFEQVTSRNSFSKRFPSMLQDALRSEAAEVYTVE